MKNVLYSSKLPDININNKQTFPTNQIINPIKKHFNIQNQSGSYGVELVWRIFNANKHQDNEEYSVFYFEKKLAEKLHKPRRRETVCEVLRKECNNLLNFGHCKILKIVHPLEESNESLAFATERVQCSLANVLGNHVRMDNFSIKDLSTLEISELNLKMGIYQVTEALRYLNTGQQFNHNNCSPYTILITPQYGWKLAGMGFLQKYSSNQNSALPTMAWNPKNPKMIQPCLDFIAPEIELESSFSETSDMFSLGLVICSIYSKTCHSLINSRNTLSVYIERINRLSIDFKDVSLNMPEELRKPIERMLSLDVKYRPNLQLFSLLKYFNDPVLLGLEGLLNISHQDPERQFDTFNSLRNAIDQMPQDILFKSIFKTLIHHANHSNKDCFKVIVDLLEEIVRISSIHSFDEFLCFDLIDLLKSITITKDRIDCLHLVDALSEKMKEDAIRNILTPFIVSDLVNADSETQILMFCGVSQLGSFTSKSFVLESLFEITSKLFFHTNNQAVQLAILELLGSLINDLGREKINTYILPFLMDIKYENSLVLTGSLNILKQLLVKEPDMINCKVIACHLMQLLVPETVNPRLKITEFRLLMDVLHIMLDRIDKEYWKSHSSPKTDFEFSEEGLSNQVPRIEMTGVLCHSRESNKSNVHNQEVNESSPFTFSREQLDMIKDKEGSPKCDITSHNNLMQPILSTIAKSSPTTPTLFHKQSKSTTHKVTSSTTTCLESYTSLNVPLNSGRRHSFGSSTALHTSNDMITASVCEGPFFGQTSQPGNLYSGSRRPSTVVLPPSPSHSMIKRESSERLTVIPISRRSSFNALSDTVMNLFH